MVCLGNICRSPLAEGLLRYKSKEYGLNLEIDSAGTGGWHVGEAPDMRTTKNALKHGVDISSLSARQIKLQDLDFFDRIYVMDKSNLANVQAIAKPNQLHKISLILDTVKDSISEVPDPYYGDEDSFEEVFQLLYKATDAICKSIIEKKDGNE